MAEEQITVTRADDRYEVRVDGQVAGYTTFESDLEGRLVFPHTVVEPEYGGRGLGKILVGEAMKDAASRGETVVPVCSFVVRYLQGIEVPGLKVDWPEAG